MFQQNSCRKQEDGPRTREALFPAGLRFLAVALVLAFVSGRQASAQTLAHLYSAQGVVETRIAPAPEWTAATTDAALKGGDAVRTGPNSRAALRFEDGVMVRLNEKTLLEIKSTAAGQAGAPLRLESGGAYFFIRQPQRTRQVETPMVTAAVRGTEFVVEVGPDTTVVSVLDGAVECTNPLGSTVAGAGEQVLARRDAAPVKRVLLRPFDAVQWALYYPAVLDIGDYAEFLDGATEAQRAGWEALERGDWPAAAHRFDGPHWRDGMGRSLLAYQQGDLARAFRELESVAAPRPASLELYRAALALAAGQVTQAEAALAAAETTLAATPADVQSRLRAAWLSERSIIALTTNHRDEAGALAQQAVAANEHSPGAALASSYAWQARYRLDEARRWAETAVRLQPASGALRARLAELDLGFGDLDAATRAAREAVRIAPAESRAWTVLGFAHLTRYETALALEAFRRAIALDAAAGLPHVGLGLALIRRDQLLEGRREIEAAVSLEPLDSSFRSYLGKAYFEERRDWLAGHEYEMARSLDPLDPTPYLYDAYNKLGNTRPIEALWDVEDSIRLNNHRAVYRSRLLLDQDLAVRAASLSQVLTATGFSEAGRIEALKSINRDYGNFAAHALLVGTYAAIPELASAAGSEQLITRLLSPVNLNAATAASAFQPSFNEYTPLFDRQRPRFFLSAEARSGDDYVGGQVVQSGALERLAYALSYWPQYSCGFRDNDWSRSHDGLFFGQFQLSPADILTLDVEAFTQKSGDTFVGFDRRIFNPVAEADTDGQRVRVGYHHRFGPSLDLIGQVAYAHHETEQLNAASPFSLLVFSNLVFQSLIPIVPDARTEDVSRQGWDGDIQLIWDSEWVSAVVGGGAFDSLREKDDTVLLIFGPESTASSLPERAQRAYLYSTWHATRWLDLTLGGSYTRIEMLTDTQPPFADDTTSMQRVNPKAGVAVYLTPNTTLRAGYVETLDAHTSDFDSIEPTQVAGLNQATADLPGTRSQIVSAGLDHKWPKRAYVGVEATHRELTRSTAMPSFVFIDTELGFVDIEPTVFQSSHAREDRLKAYYYQVLHKTVTGTVDYWVDRLTPIDDAEIITHGLRLGLQYFHPRGWFAGASTTWRYQDLSGYGAVQDGIRDFWVADAHVGYAFPKRYGSVTLAVNNLFDRDYVYLRNTFDPASLPVRTVSLRVTLNY